MVCDSCQWSRKAIIENSQVRVKSYSDYYKNVLSEAEAVDIEEDSRAGVIRYLATSQLSGAQIVDLTGKYRNSASAVALLTQELIDVEKPNLVIGHHGIYVLVSG